MSSSLIVLEHSGTSSSSFIHVSVYGVLTFLSPDSESPKSAAAVVCCAGAQNGSAYQGYVSALFATGPTWLAAGGREAEWGAGWAARRARLRVSDGAAAKWGQARRPPARGRSTPPADRRRGAQRTQHRDLVAILVGGGSAERCQRGAHAQHPRTRLCGGARARVWGAGRRRRMGHRVCVTKWGRAVLQRLGRAATNERWRSRRCAARNASGTRTARSPATPDTAAPWPALRFPAHETITTRENVLPPSQPVLRDLHSRTVTLCTQPH